MFRLVLPCCGGKHLPYSRSKRLDFDCLKLNSLCGAEVVGSRQRKAHRYLDRR